MLVTIPRADRAGVPGHWFPHREPGFAHVQICCPECGQSSTLHREFGEDRGHAIADNGMVTPSVVCPHAGCQWHVWVRLEGWADR